MESEQEKSQPTLAEQVAADKRERETRVNEAVREICQRERVVPVIVGRSETQLGGQQVTVQTVEWRAV